MPPSRTTKVLFRPPGGREKYKQNDYIILCKDTPIPFDKLPTYLLKHPSVRGWHAPWLWLGWAGEDRLLKIVEKHFPEALVRREDRTKILKLDSVLKLPKLIINKLQLPVQEHKYVRVVDVFRKSGRLDVALVVGNNFEGALDEDQDWIKRIADELFDGKMPMWYLCNMRYRWVPQRCGERPVPPNAIQWPDKSPS
ncbi:hypothetical protein VKT23_010368 [Stygiomarasmius scandens]|uniref:Uncharacterized protein n=1 Tax=Marasmiellus scandens TaxID=2682957 RepID=A0ABR1JCC5_9AGAR